MISLASWAQQDTTVNLKIDWQQLGSILRMLRSGPEIKISRLAEAFDR